MTDSEELMELHFDLTSYLRATKIMLRRQFKVWTFFSVPFFLDIIGMLTEIAVFFYIGTFVGQAASPYLTEFEVGYTTFMIVGIALNSYLTVALTSVYTSLCDGYFGGGLEFYLSSPIGIWVYIGSSLLFNYFRATLRVIFYFLFGVFLFGVTLNLNVFSSLIVMFLGITAVTGLGLIGASTFSLKEAKGYTNPIQWIVGMLAGVVSGVYIPLGVLEKRASWLLNLSYMLPQTYALRALRHTFLNGTPVTNPVVLNDITTLAFFNMILVPVGLFLFKKGLEKDEKEGTISVWT